MARLLDLHVHPSLKMYYLPYLRANFHALVYAGAHWNPLSFRTQYLHLSKSPEKVMLCAHYVIEHGFVKEGIRPAFRAIAQAISLGFYRRLTTQDPWQALMGEMETLENAVDNSNRWSFGKGKKTFKMVRSFEEIDALADNEIGMIHAIEGSHALGYAPGEGQSIDEYWEQTRKRLRYLRQRGLAMITLAHFWDNMFAPQTEGTELGSKVVKGEILPRKEDEVFHMKRAQWKWGDPGKLSETMARELMDLGILIDVSHTQEHARWAIYDLCAEYKRPVVASHVGLQHFFNHEYNMSDAEIKKIHQLGGVIGLIPSRKWLVDPVVRHGSKGDGIDDIIENMQYIKALTGDVSCIGIGTDFDGLTDPFKDMWVPSQLNDMARKMAAVFTEQEIDDILYGNSLRVLRNGWVAPKDKALQKKLKRRSSRAA